MATESGEQDDLLQILLKKQMMETVAERSFQRLLLEPPADETSASTCSTSRADPAAPVGSTVAPGTAPTPGAPAVPAHGAGMQEVPFKMLRDAVELCYAERLRPTPAVVAFFMQKLAPQESGLAQVLSSTWKEHVSRICRNSEYFVVEKGHHGHEEIFFSEEPEWFTGWWSPYPADVFALERTYALRKAYDGKPYRSLGELIQCSRAALAASAALAQPLRQVRRPPTPPPPPPREAPQPAPKQPKQPKQRAQPRSWRRDQAWKEWRQFPAGAEPDGAPATCKKKQNFIKLQYQ